MYKSTQQTIYAKLNWNTERFSFKIYRILITFTLVTVAWAFFRANSFSSAIEIIGNIGNLDYNDFFNGRIYEYGLNEAEVRIAILSTLLMFSVEIVNIKINIKHGLFRQNLVFRWSIYYLIVFFLLIFGYYNNDQANFIYFQF